MRKLMQRLAVLAAIALAGPAAAVTMDWTLIGAPGNAADTTGFGAVQDTYRVATHEVTNAQYVEFLNAVAGDDTNGLYNTEMATDVRGGITRSGGAGSFSYSTIAGRENKPVVFVSFFDALRFANWMHNGQGSGAQNTSTTEDGAYTLTGGPIARNAGATIFLASEDEWYKAAYYTAVSSSYFDFPAGSDLSTTCALPSASANTANCGNVAGANLTDVGAYTGSPSPFGTFDQGGNAFEWTEGESGPRRVVRGGDFRFNESDLAAASSRSFDPTLESDSVGFRVAAVPEPGTGLLLMAGLLGLAGLHQTRR